MSDNKSKSVSTNSKTSSSKKNRSTTTSSNKDLKKNRSTKNRSTATSSKHKKNNAKVREEIPQFKALRKQELDIEDPKFPGYRHILVHFDTTDRDQVSLKQHIRKFAQLKSNELEKGIGSNGSIRVSLKFQDGQYRTAKMTQYGETVQLWDPQDSDDYNDHGDIIGFTFSCKIPPVE